MLKHFNALLIGMSAIFVSCDDPTETASEELLCEGAYTTKDVMTDISEEIYNDDESVKAYSKYAWSSDGSSRILSGNGIPNHPVGTFPNPNNPNTICLLYTSPSPRDLSTSRMPSSA